MEKICEELHGMQSSVNTSITAVF